MNELLVVATFLVALVTLSLVLIGWRAMHISERAWLTVKSVRWANWDVPGKTARVTIILQNTGKSPANEVETSFDSDKRPEPRRSGPMPALDWIDPQRTTVGPDTYVRYDWDMSENRRAYRPSEDDVQDIKNNKLFLFVYGETRYRDIFNKPHRTTWCFYNPEPSVPASKSRHCNVWNHAE